MIKRWLGWIACRLGLHAWWRNDGQDLGIIGPRRNEAMRCACIRRDCTALHLGVSDRAEVVRRKFQVIDGAGLSTGELAIADLRVLPAPADPVLDEFMELNG